MSFEVKDKDLNARIGKLKTKSGTVETPLLFPVINPNIQLVTPKRLKDVFGFEAVITNAYILKRRFQNEPIVEGLHKFLDFEGVVMTDSGAYQILVYGGVEVNQTEIVEYQEKIRSDIATILDVPTGWKTKKADAAKTVEETLRRATEFFKTKTRDEILWVGPVQGGRYLDLLAKSATETGKLPFQIYALGSPTEVMGNYRFDVMVDMIITAKMNLPIQRPLHLFGAGHPIMFSLAIALGCDLFDSAAYALYARENRYMTENGTWKLSELDYFPCTCPKCADETPKEVNMKPPKERETFLAEHNLYVCQAELKRIKQAIREGRLWEQLETRAHTHPALLKALKKLRKNGDFIEKFSPTVKRKGIFFFSSIGLARPEVIHYKKRMEERYLSPENARVLLLVPQTQKKPFHKAYEFKKIEQAMQHLGEKLSRKIHICYYAAPFGLIPFELDEVYPLSQHEIALPLDEETKSYVAKQVSNYIKRTNYERVVLLHDPEHWNNSIKKLCKSACKKKRLDFECFDIPIEGNKNILTRLEIILRKQLRE